MKDLGPFRGFSPETLVRLPFPSALQPNEKRRTKLTPLPSPPLPFPPPPQPSRPLSLPVHRTSFFDCRSLPFHPPLSLASRTTSKNTDLTSSDATASSNRPSPNPRLDLLPLRPLWSPHRRSRQLRQGEVLRISGSSSGTVRLHQGRRSVDSGFRRRSQHPRRSNTVCELEPFGGVEGFGRGGRV